jgi:endogenous inhibitor of DNA gyrase (YacG/DUF329 family)
MPHGEDNTIPLATVRAKGARCPICGRPTEAETRPFCSRRCADIDLSRWLGGVYAVAGEKAPGEDE